MQVYTVWGVRKHSPEEPELMVAWDEFSIDSNPEGFDKDVAKAVKSWGEDLLTHRTIMIHVSDRDVLGAFAGIEVEGVVG